MDQAKELKLHNPLSFDFIYTWFDDKNEGHEIKLQSGQFTTLPYDQAMFMAKHLADAIYMDRGCQNYEEHPKIMNEVIQYDLV